MSTYARPPAHAGPAQRDTAHLRSKDEFAAAASPKELTQTDVEFMQRMDSDTGKRRRERFINDLSAQFPADNTRATAR